ncbi:MAG: PEGA domain-containing protein [Opitutaceae bacterium]|nr:PEGA domain-containing protein [Opitutaceae bacterium]
MSDFSSTLRPILRSPGATAAGVTAAAAVLLIVLFVVVDRPDTAQQERDAAARLAAATATNNEAEAQARQLREAQAAAALQHARTLAGRGSLSIETTPVGAEISINDRPFGSTPFEGKDLPLGKYAVRLLRYGYAHVDREFVLQDGAKIVETIPLIRDTGTLAVDTAPSGLPVRLTAESDEDGVEPIEAAAPFERTIPTGNYQLTVQREGFAPAIRTVGVSRGDTTRQTVSLMPGKLELISVPAGAAVYRSGEQVGVTPYILEDLREEGNMYFEIKLDGYEDSSAYVNIQYGEVTRETVKLVKIATEQSD